VSCPESEKQAGTEVNQQCEEQTHRARDHHEYPFVQFVLPESCGRWPETVTKEDQEGSKFEDRRNWSRKRHCIVNTAQPVQSDATRPQRPGRRKRLTAQMDSCGATSDRIETDAQDERPDPSEDLGMPVLLNPCRRDGVRRAMTADRQQVPNAQKSSGSNMKISPVPNKASADATG